MIGGRAVESVDNVGPLDGPRSTAVLCVGSRTEIWASTIESLTRAHVPVIALVEPGTRFDARLEALDGFSASSADLVTMIERLEKGPDVSLFLATAPVVIPPGGLDAANALMDDDVRVATVSFWSNNANYLSFPDRNRPSGLVANGHNEESLTQVLRAIPAVRSRPTPIPVPVGAGVLLSCAVLTSIGGLDRSSPSPEVAVLDFALRAARRGMINAVDPSTFVTRPLTPSWAGDAVDDPFVRHWLHVRYPEFPSGFDAERDSAVGPLAGALEYCRAATFGLRIAIDASCLGPYEMGTQVSVLNQIDALAQHPGVSRIFVGTPGGSVPAYAGQILQHSKVVVCPEDGGNFPGVHDVDVLHRPFQPSGYLPFEHWRRIARRTVVTIQDLIAYENGSYFMEPGEWQAYRAFMRRAACSVDRVVALSHDTRRAIQAAWLPIAPDAVTVVEAGTDHLRPTESTPTVPVEMLRADAVGAPFILVMGASYGHKNRDIAVQAWHELRRRGSAARLVLAGAVVPFGSTRDAEALAVAGAERPIVLPDVTSSERDWLLKHADVVAYPTSAEGFGLVPFEAAAFGTPCAFVGFGPLDELLADVPVRARDWSPSAMADVLEYLMQDADAARAQVDAVRSSSGRLTWAHCADRLVTTYLETLGRPRISAVGQ